MEIYFISGITKKIQVGLMVLCATEKSWLKPLWKIFDCVQMDNYSFGNGNSLYSFIEIKEKEKDMKATCYHCRHYDAEFGCAKDGEDLVSNHLDTLEQEYGEIDPFVAAQGCPGFSSTKEVYQRAAECQR